MSLFKAKCGKWFKQNMHKVFMAVIVMIFGTAICIYFSNYLHTLLDSHKLVSLFSIDIQKAISSILDNKKHRMLFLLLEGFVFTFALYLIFADNKPYQSDVVMITPDISIPVAAGQGQFGSAAFLLDKDYDKVFGHFLLDPNHPVVKHLIETGADDLLEEGGDNCDSTIKQGSEIAQGATQSASDGIVQQQSQRASRTGEQLTEGIIGNINAEIRRIETRAGRTDNTD